jgi:hypothetical protein
VKLVRVFRDKLRNRSANFRASPRVSVAIPAPVSSVRSAVAAETVAGGDAPTVEVIAAAIAAEAAIADAAVSSTVPVAVAAAISKTAGVMAIQATGIRAVRN